MHLFRHYQHFSTDEDFASIVTVGNFDGMHLGHQHLFSQMLALAKQAGVQSVALVFEPQPQEFFSPEKSCARLSTLRDKAELLQQFKLDFLICQRFDEAFSKISADCFINDILLKTLRVKTLFVGNDFRFGFQREGNVDMLRRAGAQHQFQVIEYSPILLAGERISSTRIRHCLAMGDLEQAAQLLGRPYCMKGRVIHGDKRGRLLGFPTANFAIKRKLAPISGVFVVRIGGLECPYYGVANVGKRPTLDGIRHLLEVHVFNFSGDLYAKTLQIEFLVKLRDEQRFANIAELQAQIARDCAQARTIVSAYDKLPVQLSQEKVIYGL